MMITPKARLLAGATPLCAQLERKDDNPAAVSTEVKKAVEELAKTFEDFKTKNDQRLSQAEKKGEDAVTKDELEKLNKGIDDAKADLEKKLEELAAKANRLGLGGGQGSEAEAKALAVFRDLTGKADATSEQLADYRKSVDAYMRREEKAVTLQVGVDPSGGYLVAPDMNGRIVQKVYESTPMRQLATVVQIGTDALEGPIDNGEFDAAWVGERAARQQTDAAQLGMWRIEANELYAYPRVTQKVLDDARLDLEPWIAGKVSSKFARKENAAFATGDGNKKPKGLFSYATAATADATRAWGTFQHIVSGANGAFAGSNPADKLLDLIFETKAQYRQNANFLMARRTVGGVRKLKDGQGNYLVDLRLRDGALVESIFGFPVFDGEDVPAFTTNDALAIAFGDFAEAYIIVDRLGITVVRDNITEPGFVKFNFRRRTGGGAVNFEAVKFMKFSAS